MKTNTLIKSISLGLFLVFTLGFSSAFSQQKIGCINSNSLITMMPENDSAQTQLAEKRAEFAKQTEELRVELNKKYEAYMRDKDTLTPLILKTKEDEINGMSTNIDNFGRAAEQELQRLNQVLYQPIIDKAQNAINEVAKEQGFTYIIDLGTGAMVYFPEEAPLNILEAVKTKLGLE